MKKAILTSLLCLLGSVALWAQNVVSGIVVDNKNIPIPGAKVEVVGGTESAITELDGTFRIDLSQPAKKVRVQYAGLQGKTAKIKPDMKVKLTSNSWWRSKPEKANWFIGPQVTFPAHKAESPAFGFMAGCVKHFGFYVRGSFRIPHGWEDYEDTEYNQIYTGRTKVMFANINGGLLVRLGCPIYLYIGGGLAERHVLWELADRPGKYTNHYEWYTGVLDCGLMIRYKRIGVTAGITTPLDRCVGNLGINIFL